MAILNQQYTEFNREIKLSKNKKESLEKSRNSLKDKIQKWFRENKPDELQPKFWGQGSFEMNTTVNPIPTINDTGETLLKYDLDYGVYFIEQEGEDNKRAINTWHDWVFDSVDNHTQQPTDKKTTCVRVNFKDGHHIDLPIYYKKDDVIQLAHKAKSWIDSDPKAFVEWFHDKKKNNQQLSRIVRYLKAWKNYRETKNTNLKLPSGFALTILAANNYQSRENDDEAFLETLKAIQSTLNIRFECCRPTAPKGENVFEEYSEIRKSDFLNNLDALIKACEGARDEPNQKKASELIRKHLGDRFPLGKDKTDEDKSNGLSQSLGSHIIKPKPYATV